MRLTSILPLFTVVLISSFYYTRGSSQTEVAAGKAISKLLQEKISAKFKEAANDVKTILVKHLGASLQDAHSRMNSKQAKKAASAAKKAGRKKGASIHQNKAGRHRKNSGAAAAFAPPKSSAQLQQQQQQQQQQQMAYGMTLPGQPALAQPRPAAVQQCGGNCPTSCAPACDNTCCQMALQQGSISSCPSSCSMSCFPYCAQQCCPHKKDTIPTNMKKQNDDKEDN